MKDRFREQIAELTSRAFREILPEWRVVNPGLFTFHPEELYYKLETPKNPQLGNFALPLFELTKIIKQNPVELNKKLTDAQNKLVKENEEYVSLTFNAVGGYNNARIATGALAAATFEALRTQKENYGSSTEGRGRKIVIDFSSPNIAKPFGIGHLRSTAIGNSLYRIFNKLGYESVGINHLGDWGTQFGKTIVAYRKWGKASQLEENPVKTLFDLYVRFHKEEEADASLSDAARDAFKAMENGDPEAIALWQKFKDYSMAEFNRIYEMLRVHFDYQTGESFYNDKMESAIKRLEKAGLTEISEGALIVNLEKYNLPACLLRRADGATLYATRDIAGILYRWETFHFEKALYVVGTAQRDHFKQVFKVIELLEEAEHVSAEKRIAHRLTHVEFGWIKFEDEVMATRQGNIIFLEDVLDKAISLAREKIVEKNPDLKEIDKTAHQIGLGAVIFADLSTRKEKDVNFQWDKVLNFEGETGPYLQYTHARLSSLIRHYGKELTEKIDFSLLDHPEEYRVLDLLYRFPLLVEEAAIAYEPYLISSYLLELASAFNTVYQRKDAAGRIDKIISDNTNLTEARMALVAAARIVVKEGLYLLGIEAPEEM
ncbi:MAG: arginine--tRNA ligase [candidate division Zixibacteria bacterium]|nr:arginine--tRNA ligase [candidate division Zixibacteria bacterium]